MSQNRELLVEERREQRCRRMRGMRGKEEVQHWR
jgi:hypothetical protein